MKIPTKMALSTKLIVSQVIPLAVLLLLTGALTLVTRSVKDSVHLSREESVVFYDVGWQMKLDVAHVQQFLSDISATRGKDGLDGGFKEAEEHQKVFLAGLAKFRSMYEREKATEQLLRIREVEKDFATYYEVGTKMAAAYVAGGPEVGNKMMAEFDAAAEVLHKHLNPFIESQRRELYSSLSSIESRVTQLSNATLIAGLVSLVLGVVVVRLLLRSIVRPIEMVSEALSAGAQQTNAAAGRYPQPARIWRRAPVSRRRRWRRRALRSKSYPAWRPAIRRTPNARSNWVTRLARLLRQAASASA